ncbi:MAG: 16S rRNA (cytosine(1402)-N(4))-methyltransferase RsmH [Alphaproteobacteria bacterium]
MMTNSPHIPVMLNEVLEHSKINDNDIVVDGTFGAGGYTGAILESCNCTVYAIDRDPDAIKRAEPLLKKYPDRFKIIQGCFGDMQQLLKDEGIDNVDVIVLDLGVSSPQLDEAERGFSFKKDGVLDMRMSQSGLSAMDIVNTYSHGEIAHIIKHYGEEKMAGQVASAILRHRENEKIETTSQLADIVRSVVKSKNSKIDPATRTFQGIRIAVNDELGEVERCLDGSIELLNKGGRLVIVSFHSLEDRIVKKFIKYHSEQDSVNRHIPIGSDKKLSLEVGNKKFIQCSDEEAQINVRARSAKLRMATKI